MSPFLKIPFKRLFCCLFLAFSLSPGAAEALDVSHDISPEVQRLRADFAAAQTDIFGVLAVDPVWVKCLAYGSDDAISFNFQQHVVDDGRKVFKPHGDLLDLEISPHVYSFAQTADGLAGGYMNSGDSDLIGVFRISSGGHLLGEVSDRAGSTAYAGEPASVAAGGSRLAAWYIDCARESAQEIEHDPVAMGMRERFQSGQVPPVKKIANMTWSNCSSRQYELADDHLVFSDSSGQGYTFQRKSASSYSISGSYWMTAELNADGLEGWNGDKMVDFRLSQEGDLVGEVAFNPAGKPINAGKMAPSISAGGRLKVFGYISCPSR